MFIVIIVYLLKSMCIQRFIYLEAVYCYYIVYQYFGCLCASVPISSQSVVRQFSPVFYNFSPVKFCKDPHIFDYPSVETDSGLRAYLHRDVDFPNVWERCWPTRTIPIRESVDSLCRDGADTPMPPYIGKAFTRTNFEDLSLFRYLTIVYESLCTQ